MEAFDLEQRITSTMQNYQNLLSSRAKLNSLLPQTTSKESVMQMLNEFRNNKKITNQRLRGEAPKNKKRDEILNPQLDSMKKDVLINNRFGNSINNKNYQFINYEKDFNEKTEGFEASNLKMKPPSNYSYHHDQKSEKSFHINTDRNFNSLQKKIDIMFSPPIPQKTQNLTERKTYNLNPPKNESGFEKTNFSLLSNFSNKENLNSFEKKKHIKNGDKTKKNAILQFNEKPDQKIMTNILNKFFVEKKENSKNASSSEQSQNISKSKITARNDDSVENRMALKDINKNIKIEKMIFERERKVLGELKEKPDISINSKHMAGNAKERKREPDLVKRLLEEKKIQQVILSINSSQIFMEDAK